MLKYSKKQCELEQHHVMDKIRALDDSFISVESGLVQRINALQIEAKNIQENLNRLQYIYFMTNIDQNYSIIALNTTTKQSVFYVAVFIALTMKIKHGLYAFGKFNNCANVVNIEYQIVVFKTLWFYLAETYEIDSRNLSFQIVKEPFSFEQRSYMRWLYKRIYKSEMKFWAGLLMFSRSKNNFKFF